VPPCRLAARAVFAVSSLRFSRRIDRPVVAVRFKTGIGASCVRQNAGSCVNQPHSGECSYGFEMVSDTALRTSLSCWSTSPRAGRTPNMSWRRPPVEHKTDLFSVLYALQKEKA
jgi:hypothetical protein